MNQVVYVVTYRTKDEWGAVKKYMATFTTRGVAEIFAAIKRRNKYIDVDITRQEVSTEVPE